MWPFKPEDLFQVNPHAQAKKINDDPALVVVDDFYLRPEKVRDFVRAMPCPIWKRSAHTKNFLDYYDCRHDVVLDYLEPQRRIAEIAHELMRIHIARPTRHFVTNVFRLINEQRPGTNAHPHSDGIALAALVYLNPDEECCGGTAFYRHRDTQMEQLPIDEAEYNRLSKEIFQGDEKEDGRDYFHEWERAWELTRTVEMRFNRLLLWPGVAFHGAWHAPNSFRDTWRINQVIFFEHVEYLDG